MQRRRLSARTVTVTQTGARGGRWRGVEECVKCAAKTNSVTVLAAKEAAHQRAATVNQDCLANCEEKERREEKTRTREATIGKPRQAGSSSERHQSGIHQLGDS